MAVAPGGGTAGGDYRQLRASDTDRERAADILKAAFTEGRISQDEFDERVGKVYAARTYADLAGLTSDVPSGPPAGLPLPGTAHGAVAARPPVNSMAVASLACGIGVWFTGGLTAIPAIICGHIARSQIRRTGESGAGLAAVGLAFGWLVPVLVLIALVALFAVGGTH